MALKDIFVKMKDRASDTAIKSTVAVASVTGEAAFKAEVLGKVALGKNHVVEIATLCKSIPGVVGRTVAEIAICADEIIVLIEAHPELHRTVRSFLDYNLNEALKVIKSRVDNVKILDSEAVENIDATIKDVLKNFIEFHVKCETAIKQNVRIDSNTLSSVISSNI